MTSIIEFVTPYLDDAIASDDKTLSDLYVKVKADFLKVVTDKEIPAPSSSYVLNGEELSAMVEIFNYRFNSYAMPGLLTSSKTITPAASPEFRKTVRRFMEENEGKIRDWWNQRELEKPFFEELNKQGKEGNATILPAIAHLIKHKTTIKLHKIIDDFKLYEAK